MGIHLYTHPDNRADLTMTNIVGCSCGVDHDSPLRFIDDGGNRISLQVTGDAARSMHRSWTEAMLAPTSAETR